MEVLTYGALLLHVAGDALETTAYDHVSHVEKECHRGKGPERFALL